MCAMKRSFNQNKQPMINDVITVEDMINFVVKTSLNIADVDAPSYFKMVQDKMRKLEFDGNDQNTVMAVMAGYLEDRRTEQALFELAVTYMVAHTSDEGERESWEILLPKPELARVEDFNGPKPACQ